MTRGTPTDRIKPLLRRGAKAVFAAADLLLGEWPGPRILIYHDFSSGSGREMDLPFPLFEDQIEWIQANGQVVSLEEALGPSKPPAGRTFVLTFDDGYRAMYEDAFPLLVDRQLPFTLYLTTHPIDRQQPLAPGDRPLVWDHINEMAGSGLMTVGSHTHRHPDLRGLTKHEINDELETSDDLIRQHTGLTSLHFAYPKGYWDPVAEDLIRERYETAVLGAGPPIRADTDRHRLHRLPVQRSDGMFFFKRKTLRGMRLEESVRRLLRGYVGPRR